MSNELFKIAEGLHLMSEGVRSLAEQNSCGCREGKSESVEHTVATEEGQIEAEENQSQTSQVTIEEVREVMANKSQDGKTQQVKALLRKYGAEKLSGVQPEQYKALFSDAKGL